MTPLEDKLLMDLRAMKKASADARMPSERDAWLNTAFYLNEQYVAWDDQAKAIAPIPRDPKNKRAPRPIVNKIMHYVQQTHASALQDRLQMDVLPATDDQKDISTAQVAKAFLDMQMLPTVANYDRNVSKTVLWAIICGQGYLKWYWDSKKNQLCIEPVGFLEGYPDPYARDWTKWRWFIHSNFMDPEQVYDIWGVDVDRSALETADPDRTTLTRGMGSTPVLQGVTVNEYWAKPSRRYPKGRYAVWAGSQFLVPPGDHPYAHQMLPFTCVGSLERPDSQFFGSPVTYGRSAQMALNQYHAHRITWRKNMAHGKWWIPNELQMEELPNDDPDQVLRGDGGMSGLAPQILSPPPWPADDDGSMIEQQMMNIFGLHEVSQAQVPGRVEAAKAIETLKESDADRTATLRQTMQDSAAIGGYMTLRLAQQYAPDEVLVMAYSREGLQEVKQFRAADLKPGFGVNTSWTTGLARSRTAKTDLLLRMWDSQAITDPSRLADLLEVPTPQLLSSDAMDVRLAKNENIVMAQNQAVVPNSWDNHAIHIQEHNDYRKTHDFLELLTEAKMKFEMHVQQHKQLQVEDAQQQAMLMTAATPMAPQPTTPSPPAGPPAAPPSGGSDSATGPSS